MTIPPVLEKNNPVQKRKLETIRTLLTGNRESSSQKDPGE